MILTKYLKSIKDKDKHLHTYLVLIVIRVLLVLIPQTGYIHPDEFFQSIEVMTGDKFDLEHVRTWEFNNSFPIRSVAIPYSIIKIPLNLLDFISTYAKYYLEIDLKTSYIFLIYPRLIICALSFFNDWSLYKICRAYSLKEGIRLMALGSSFIMLVFGTRTFSNTIEMTLCSVLLYLVSDCMIHSNTVIYKTEFLQEKYQTASSIGDKVRIYKLRSSLPAHSFNRVFLMSTLCVIGVFNRPTFLIFGAPIVFFWLLRGMGTKTITFFDFHLRIFLFCISALPSLCLFILIDSCYYKYLTAEEIHRGEIGINNFVSTPWNFIKYNIDPSNTGQHGLHPKYLHLLVNMPLLYNILGIVTVCSFANLLLRFCKGAYQHLPRSQSIVGIMTSSIFAPLFVMSLINHQEPRFLLPITLPIILLHSPKLITGFCTSYPFNHENRALRYIYNKILSTRASSKHLIKIWFTINIILTVFFGFIHQGGVYQLSEHFSNVVKQKLTSNIQIHLVTSHIYSVPVSLINIPSSKTLHVNYETHQKYRRSRQFFLYEYGGLNMDMLYKKIKLLIDISEMKIASTKRKYEIYLAIPTSLTIDFDAAFDRANSSIIKYEQVKVFYPHLSTEAMPKIFGRHPCDVHVDENDITGTCDAVEIIGVPNMLSVSYTLKQFSSLIHQFGLALYKFNIGRNYH